MESALLQRIYSNTPKLSTHRVRMVPMSCVDLQQLLLSFRLGRVSQATREAFIYHNRMTPAMFIDRNNIELVEPAYQVVNV